MTHFHVFIVLAVIAIVSASGHRSKREIFRGQDYRFQRAYELSRLRFDDRHPDRPKTFFVREFHEGHDVPKPFLQLTQPEKLADPEVTESILTGGSGEASPSPLIETGTPASRQASRNLYATKAAIKAALAAGDKDLSILQYLKAKEAADSEKAGGPSAGSGGVTGSVPQEHHDVSKKPNAQVQFDEQIKEDLDRIAAYDPSKSFGQRLRPYTFSPGLYPTRKPVIIPQQRPSTPVSDDYMSKLRRLYPHLFPPTSEPEFERTSGPLPTTPTVSNGHSGGHVDPLLHALGIPHPVSPFARNNTPTSGQPSHSNLPNFGGFDPYFPSLNEHFQKPNVTSGIRPFVPTPIAPFVPAANPWGFPKYPADFWSPARNVSNLFGPRLPGAAYPSRYPGNAISALTLYPNIRNSTFPGIPGYIRYDFPGYSQVPFTGFRCDQMPYQHGYYADVAAGCQAFHICQKDGRMDSFLCPNGTLFHQKVMTCDWWYLVDCPSSPGYYYLNGRIGVLPPLPATLSRFDKK